LETIHAIGVYFEDLPSPPASTIDYVIMLHPRQPWVAKHPWMSKLALPQLVMVEVN